MSDPLSITTGIITLIGATAKAIEYVKDVKSGGKDRTKLRDELRSVTCLLEMLHDRVEEQDESDNDESLRPAAVASLAGPDGPLDRMKATMEDIVAKLAPQAGFRKLAQPLQWPFDKKDILELLATIERLKSHFTLVLQNDLVALSKLTNEKVGQISQQLDDMDLRKRDEEAEQILAWMSPTSFQARQADVLQSVEPGTGKWFLETKNYRDWLAGHVNLLWCPGIPGAGKTRLASLAVNSVESTGSVFAYIYCDYNQIGSQTPSALLSSLLEQFLRRTTRSGLPEEVNSLYREHARAGTRPTVDQLAEMFRRLTTSHKNIFIVVDALDEFASSDEAALEFVDTIRRLGSNIRLLITSRHSTNFDSFFEDATRINIAAQGQDIQLYLETNIPKQSRLARHIRADPKLQEEIVQNISQNAQGMFLLAALNLDSLSRKMTRRDVRSSLSSLPKTLDATYEQALVRIRTQAQEDVELAETVIFWILCARRPLRVPELQHMYAVHCLAQDNDNKPIYLHEDDLPPGDIITGVCGGLIVVDDALYRPERYFPRLKVDMTSRVRLVHYTTQEYLLRTHHERVHESRLELTRVSLKYLQLSNFSDVPGWSIDTLFRRLDEFPFLDYAARYWGPGIDAAGMEALWEHIDGFLSNKAALSVALWIHNYYHHGPMFRATGVEVHVLVVVASFELPELLEKLVLQGHDIEGSGSDGETPLIRSAWLGHTKNITTLLRLGANIDATDRFGRTPIFKATSYKEAAAVKALIDGGANVNKRTDSSTILMEAAISGKIDIVRILIDAGADVNVQDEDGRTALTLAEKMRYRGDIAELLRDAGAS
ncbi:uncharacterized protein BKA78DRAFT_299687 [Phyllosticta capitalensis]|uniref:uncharacterized protein n=1 Tax=Phyllosticta capitalensis TaxID=121624 RepID=UPI00312D5A40